MSERDEPRRRFFPSRVVALAASTGGPAALRSLLSALPRPFPVPILVVQHLPASFTARFADQLAQACLRPVAELQPGLLLSAGSVIIATGGQHMRVERDGKRVLAFPDDGPPENSCRPSADVLVRSLVQVYGRDTLAVMLTGVGVDGVAGCQAVHEVGGRVLAQDEASSSAWGMPGATVRAGVVDRVVPLDELPGEIYRHCGAVDRKREARHR